MSETVMMSVRVPRELVDRMVQQALNEDRALSYVVRRELERAFPRPEKAKRARRVKELVE